VSSTKTLDPFRFLMISLAGWMNQRQLRVIDTSERRTEFYANSLALAGSG
jgi:hypothetical protein